MEVLNNDTSNYYFMRKPRPRTNCKTSLNLQQFPDSKVGLPVDWNLLKLHGEPPPVDAEFSGTDQVLSLFAEHGLNMGRFFGSKSAYRTSNRQCVFVPNANVCSARAGKLWWGDLDLKRDEPVLEKIAHQLKQKLYVLREGDARWGEASVIGNEVAASAFWCTGGPRRIRGLSAFLKNSGLTPTIAAKLLGTSSRFLLKRHKPGAALEFGRSLDAMAGYYANFVEDTTGIKWGHWLLRPNSSFNGETPYALLLAGRKNELTEFLRAKICNETATDT